MALSIQSKFITVSGIAVAIIAFVAFENYQTLTASVRQASTVQVATTMLRQHLDGDMMHDAIRADVLKATLGQKLKDAEMVAESKAEAAEHGARFLENVKKNLALPIPRDMRKLFQDVEPALKAYNDQAAKYIETAIADTKAGTNKTEALLPEFEKAFGVLEEVQGELSDKIEAYTSTLKQQQIDAAASAETFQISLAILSIVITAFIPIYAKIALFAPQTTLIQAMKELATGSTTVNVPHARRDDEIGDMAQALLVFQRNAEEKIRLERETAEAKKADEKARHQAMLDMADSFESKVGELVRGVAAAATELQASAESMTTTSQQAADQASSVASTSEQTAHNSNTVAAATEELASSFGDINQSATNSIRIVGEAVAQTQNTSAQLQRLDQAARKIGEVVKLIGDVAEQTNLLALNATIEAARAGEAGKGFAVVASEVKALAAQTAKATNEVEAQIHAIQSAVSDSTKAMDAVTTTIGNVNDISRSIATAVESQSAATADIARNVSEASRGTSEIQANISGVLSAARETGSAAAQVLAAAGELSRNGEVLTQQVDAFLREIRSK